MRILVLDGNTSEVNARQTACGGRPTGTGYAEVLRCLAPDVQCTIVQPAYEGYDRRGIDPGAFDGAVITGSALHVYDRCWQVANQRALVEALFAAEVPVFGSCWGLQLAAVVLGGTVRASPRGMEVGVARDIRRSEAGRGHPLLAGKPEVIEAFAIHGDEIDALPAGARVLAGNAHSPVQALEVVQDGRHFWGVQYHPEFSPGDMAAVFRRYRPRLLELGICNGEGDVEAWIAAFRRAEKGAEEGTAGDPTRLLGPWLTVFEKRTREIANWLAFLGRRCD